ncbi:MAG: hypothetical protein ACI4DU_10375 [Lachnospiraceae bacterium]
MNKIDEFLIKNKTVAQKSVPDTKDPKVELISSIFGFLIGLIILAISIFFFIRFIKLL